MDNSTLPQHTEGRSDKRRRVAAFLLATVAIGGIGAGLTSAAWTDNTFFSAPAAAATFNLQGSMNGTTDWIESDTESAIALQIPTATFANLLPGQTRSVDVWVKNDSSVPAALTTTPTWKTTTFTNAPVVTVTGAATSLAAGGTQKLTVTVKADEDWAPTNKGKTGTLVLKVAATTTTN